MSIENRAKAAAQNVEGKGQEVAGVVTGNSEDEAKGKAKQGMAKVRDGIEDAKDNIADAAKQAAEKISDGIENAKDKLKK
jgi:uncharacterized protein YjbJ (UPF0337 family)